MVHIDKEEIIDLVVGLLLLLFASLMIGYCMARIARSDDDDEDDEDNAKKSVCCGFLRKNSSSPPREFASLNELLVEVDDNNERGKVVVKTMPQSATAITADSDTETTTKSAQCFTLDSIFPNILQVKDDDNKTNGSLEEPLLRDS